MDFASAIACFESPIFFESSISVVESEAFFKRESIPRVVVSSIDEPTTELTTGCF